MPSMRDRETKAVIAPCCCGQTCGGCGFTIGDPRHRYECPRRRRLACERHPLQELFQPG